VQDSVGKRLLAIAAGSLHNLALRRDGRVEAWGENNYAQCDIPEGGQFAAIAAGDFHSLASATRGSNPFRPGPVEPQVTPVKTPEGRRQPTWLFQVTSSQRPAPADLLPCGRRDQDSNVPTTDTLLSELEERQSIPVKEIEPATVKEQQPKEPECRLGRRRRRKAVAGRPGTEPGQAGGKPHRRRTRTRTLSPRV